MKADGGHEKLEQSVELGTLCAFYGGLLTHKQLEMLRLHYEEDFSLGEIAEQFDVSRQNVHELITRSALKLRRYEAALGGVSRARQAVEQLSRAQALLGSVRDTLGQNEKNNLDEAAALIARTIAQQEGEENDHGL